MSVYAKIGWVIIAGLTSTMARAATAPTVSAKALKVQYACTQAMNEALREVRALGAPQPVAGMSLTAYREQRKVYDETVTTIMHSARIACDAAAGITTINAVQPSGDVISRAPASGG